MLDLAHTTAVVTMVQALFVYVDIGVSRGFIFREMQNICKDPNLTVHLSIFIFPSDESVARITLIIDISYKLRIS